MSEIKYKGIDTQAIKKIEKEFLEYKFEGVNFDKNKVLDAVRNSDLMAFLDSHIQVIQARQVEATEMYIICEMAKLYLEHCRDMQEILERLEEKKKNICGSYNYATPVLERPSCKIAFNNGICEAIAIVKEVGGMNE